MAPFVGTFFFLGPARARGSVAGVLIRECIHVSLRLRVYDNIKSNVDISSPLLLDIFIEDLPVHTLLSPLLSVVRSTSDRGGGIRRQRPGTSGSGSGLGPSGDQIGHF